MWLLLPLAAAFLWTGCAAGDPRFSAEAPAGFWVGLWHGVISFVTLIIGIFNDGVHVYEAHNTGGWYDFGFLLGVSCIWGSHHQHYRRRRSRKEAKEWEALALKVEHKLKRVIGEWADAEPDDDWKVVEEKARRLLKTRIREWAEEDERPASVGATEAPKSSTP
ncbi:MAG: hypothetical protein R3A51_11160 [Nannocystaceae bacterium]|nr:hypothetical protein [Myxococcales bacterium]